jgi:hypothetical protein
MASTIWAPESEVAYTLDLDVRRQNTRERETTPLSCELRAAEQERVSVPDCGKRGQAECFRRTLLPGTSRQSSLFPTLSFSYSGIAGIVCRTVERLRALIRCQKKSVIKTPGDAPHAPSPGRQLAPGRTSFWAIHMVVEAVFWFLWCGGSKGICRGPYAACASARSFTGPVQPS